MVEGEKINWNELHQENRRRVALPTYPFTRERYWHQTSKTDLQRDDQSSIAPLLALRSNTTTGNIQNELLEIIGETLGYSHLKLSDNFSNIGGDSLIAVDIASQIEKQLGYKVNINDISSVKNIGGIIDDIINANPLDKSKTLLKKLKDGDNSATPIFIIHPGNGSLFHYESFVQNLNYKGIIWGIENPVFENHYKPFNSVKDMASYYLQLIKHLKNGPYLLAGWSLGASIAFEMAYQLEASNELIANLTLIDGWYKYNPALNDDNFLYNLHAEDFINVEEGKRTLIINLLKSRFKVFMDYQPKPIKSHVDLIKAEQLTEEFNQSDNYNNWKPFVTNGISITIVPGDHITIFSKENISHLRKQLILKSPKIQSRFNNHKPLLNPFFPCKSFV